MIERPTDEPLVAVTGATGLIGHYLLARLLKSGVRCAAAVRDPQADAGRLQSLLEPLGIDAKDAISAQQLILLRGELLSEVASPARLPISDIIHVAGCTRFHLDSNGDPTRTNVQGTQRILDWASRHKVQRFHLVSTAFAGGRWTGDVEEASLPWPDEFNNDYERSKWTCEQLCREWAQQRASRCVTVLRPSIVVGEWATGRTTSNSGLYLAVHAVRTAADLAASESAGARRRIHLRLPGDPDAVQNIVPVNYVADMIAAIVSSTSHHGGHYNIVHPQPPTNEMIRTALQAALNVSGLTFASTSFDEGRRSKLERMFDRVIEPIFPYLAWSPRFKRERALEVERGAHLQCPTYDLPALIRLCGLVVQSPTAGDGYPSSLAAEAAEYFERFLPHHVPKSAMARLVGLTADVRFKLTGIAGGAWLCRFEAGQLSRVLRTDNGVKEDFGYRVDAATFLKIVATRLDPQQAFLSGQIEVTGNIEQALKMAMVLHQFNSEFPFRAGASSPVLQGAIDA